MFQLDHIKALFSLLTHKFQSQIVKDVKTLKNEGLCIKHRVGVALVEFIVDRNLKSPISTIHLDLSPPKSLIL